MGLKRWVRICTGDVLPVIVVNTVYRARAGRDRNPGRQAHRGRGGRHQRRGEDPLLEPREPGHVAVQFTMSTHLDTAAQEVRDKVANAANKLPTDAEAPVVSRVDIGAMPILTYTVSAELPPRRCAGSLMTASKSALAQMRAWPRCASRRRRAGDPGGHRSGQGRAVGLSPMEIARRIGAEN